MINKTELAQILSRRTGWSGRTSAKVISEVLDAIVIACAWSGGVHFKGFGKFQVKIAKGRGYRHPVTGVTITIPDMRTVRFTPSPNVKRFVNDPAKIGAKNANTEATASGGNRST